MHTTTNTGLHEFVAERVLSRYARPSIRAADLGSGPGAIAARLHAFGCDVLAVDRTDEDFEASLPHVELDLIGMTSPPCSAQPRSTWSQPSTSLNTSRAPLVSYATLAVCLLLRALQSSPHQTSIRSPHAQSFCSLGKSEPWTSSANPHTFLPFSGICFGRQKLTPAGVRLRVHFLFPPSRYRLSRRPIAWMFRMVAAAFPGDSILGDNHMLEINRIGNFAICDQLAWATRGSLLWFFFQVILD